MEGALSGAYQPRAVDSQPRPSIGLSRPKATAGIAVLRPLEVTPMADTAPVTTAQPPVVTLPAEIDMANADALGEQFAAALAPGVRVVIADMTATTFCGSAGLNTLIRAQQAGHGQRRRTPAAAALPERVADHEDSRR